MVSEDEEWGQGYYCLVKRGRLTSETVCKHIYNNFFSISYFSKNECIVHSAAVDNSCQILYIWRYLERKSETIEKGEPTKNLFANTRVLMSDGTRLIYSTC